MTIRLTSSLAACVLLLSLSVCGGDPVDDEAAGTSETTGDGGGGSGDLCLDACEHMLECGPVEFAEHHPDAADCASACSYLWACPAEATAYLECVLDLSCVDVIELLTEGPARSACTLEFNAAAICA